jgi:hypothetical protein
VLGPGQVSPGRGARSGRSARPGHGDRAIGGLRTAVPHPRHVASFISLRNQPSFRPPGKYPPIWTDVNLERYLNSIIRGNSVHSGIFREILRHAEVGN